MRKTYAQINLNNLKRNYLSLKKKSGNKPVMAVVKADAYGHGMIKCVEALESLGVNKPSYYGISQIEEGIELRKSKLTKSPILCFAQYSLEDAESYQKYKVMPTITSVKNISDVLKSKTKIKVHINVNTGMNRVGLDYKSAVNEILELKKSENVIVDGIYTHFATSDEKDKKYANLQLKRFNQVLNELYQNNFNFGKVHAANSGAILDLPDSYFDMIRPGISLYGYYPSLETTESVKLKPVMSLISEVSSAYEYKKGETISYGRMFKTKSVTNVVTVPIGYADGYNRGLTNKAVGIVGSKIIKQIGRVTMDRIMFDTGINKVKLNSKIILLGSKGKLRFDAWDWSKILNTIPYEITCAISKRVPRIYINI